MKIVIIGAVAGGASTAARLRRLDEHAEIILIEKGAYISYANCGLPYYIGNVIKERDKLFIQTAKSFTERFNIDVRTNTEAIGINKLTKEIELFDHKKGDSYIESYDKLVLSPGAIPIIPPLPGIHLNRIYTVRNIHDTDLIKEAVGTETIKHITVIGAGFIGLEMVENLHHLGIKVTLIERFNQVLPQVDYPLAAIAQKVLREKGIELRLNSSVTGFEKSSENDLTVYIEGSEPLTTDLVILSIGVKPNSKLAVDADLKTGQYGGILVNEYLTTSDPSIYAVGDVIEFQHPITKQHIPTYLAGPANKQGRICANNIIFGNTSKYKGSINTAIVKIFDFTFATAGLTERHLKQLEIPYFISTNFAGSHAGYYPGAETLLIQIVFSPEDGKLLGAQVAGNMGVDKRIDVLSILIQQGGTIHDLTEFEQAYAPPFSSAKDPLNMAGFAAENLRNNLNHLFQWNEIEDLKEKYLLIDVRSVEEFNEGSIENAISFPLEQIRTNMHELDKDHPLALFCKTGIKSYIALRILIQYGFNVINLAGGYDLWKICKDGMANPSNE